MWSSINALQLFDEVYFLTKGGPGTSTYVVVYYLYSLAFPRASPGTRPPSPTSCWSRSSSLTAGAALGRPPSRVLRVMTSQIASQVLDPPRRPADEEEREPGRFLFSPWHLVLIPIAVVMLIPMVWMLVTSLETLNETRHFPPMLLPHTLRPGNYTQVLRQAPFARWFLNTLIVTVVTVARQPAVLQPGRLRLRPDQVLRPRGRVRAAAGDADDPVPGDHDPDVPDRERTSG